MNKSFSIDYWNKTLLRQDTIQMFLKNFVEKNLVLLCSLIDENGIIIASKIDDSLEKSVEDEIMILAYGLISLVNNKEGILLIERNIEPMSYFEIDTSKVLAFIKTIEDGLRLITIIPSWVGLDSILPEFKKIIKIITNNFKSETNQEDIQYNVML